MEACYKAANEVYAEIVGQAIADFKKIYDSMMAFRNDQYLWWQVAEYRLRQLRWSARAP